MGHVTVFLGTPIYRYVSIITLYIVQFLLVYSSSHTCCDVSLLLLSYTDNANVGHQA
jgi:hypothetical protein